MFPDTITISIRTPVNEFVANLATNYGLFFRHIAAIMLSGIQLFETSLRVTPWWLLILLVSTLSYLGRRSVVTAIATGALLFVIGILGLWSPMIQTLALMLMSTLIAVLIGIPVGILCAKSRYAGTIIRPVLDVMQTMPGFVYLIPMLMLFGLGKVPAVFATIIFALPPIIRLTDLGIREVNPEIVEAAKAFGANPLQLLFGAELPVALPTVMAGVNQTIMMALGMVVVASMIGARGLGEQVLHGIQTLDVGEGLEAGIGIVILAIVLDRTTQGFARIRGGADRHA